jgi:hypothetical protein
MWIITEAKLIALGVGPVALSKDNEVLDLHRKLAHPSDLWTK